MPTWGRRTHQRATIAWFGNLDLGFHLEQHDRVDGGCIGDAFNKDMAWWRHHRTQRPKSELSFHQQTHLPTCRWCQMWDECHSLARPTAFDWEGGHHHLVLLVLWGWPNLQVSPSWKSRYSRWGAAPPGNDINLYL
jgi:hypothetical protein